jgi:NAD(P)-dependent dehydrogenase (short-subunit alcohol dehydrogenase family)
VSQSQNVWFVTGAGRGMGVDIAKAALAAGNAVVATGRNPEAVSNAVGESGDLLAVRLFGVEGWMESLRPEVEPFGIHTTIVNPGFFRTQLLTPESTNDAAPMIDDYADRRETMIAAWNAQNGKQSGDPRKLAAALVEIAAERPPRRRFIAGADSIASTEAKVADLQADIDPNRAHFISLDVVE